MHEETGMKLGGTKRRDERKVTMMKACHEGP